MKTVYLNTTLPASTDESIYFSTCYFPAQSRKSLLPQFIEICSYDVNPVAASLLPAAG